MEKQKLKIGIVATNGFYPLTRGGPPILSYQMVRCLLKRGHELHVVTTAQYVDRIKDVLQSDRLTLKPIFRPRIRLIQANLEMLSALREFLRNCDIVNYNSPPIDLEIYWPLVLRLAVKPQTYFYVGDIHNHIVPFTSFRINVKFLNKVVAPCYYICEILRRIGVSQDRIAYIPEGIDCDPFRVANAIELEGDPAILHLAPLVSYKDVPTILLAFRQVLQNLPQARLHLVGAGPMEVAYRALASQLNVDQKVIWHGHRDYSEVPSFIKGADMVVFSPTPKSNGMGLAAMETMAANKPLIINSIPGNREFFRDGSNALLFNSGDFMELARKIELVATDKELAIRVANGGNNFIQRYNWPNLIPHFEEMWRSLLVK